ncbi:ABC-F family ATP-binding cassette domain-containing protein [Spirochaeta lutea]|uniref:Probable ATP-binding protein YbiT n=1 Tax=Spirochaeta lutea TaxID=1480694 RepID=A0A098R131_9SPIO|nr:ATP-binding cassette domain-containing protein [Spirochaeta lutea]KGE72427.1 ABC transporter ATP-binding protein [Spirochaeta lutea]
MITVSDLSLTFGTKPLFKEVNLKFTPGNCYGVIGANGAGKSTFLKVLSGELDNFSGEVSIAPGLRMSVLGQNQYAYDEHSVIHTVIMGNKTLYDIMVERETLYSKSDLTEEEGMRVGEIEGLFGEMGGYEAEAEASILLSGLGIEESLHYQQMGDLEGSQKVRVLLAQALFGNPDILLLDEPTNHLDLESINWLEDFLSKFENTVIVVSHDRHFLNQVCTHICDVDYGNIRMYVGNYDFWYQASQLIAKQKKDEKRRAEDKAAELKEFIQRFSSNASKAKQATSRKKLLEKLDLGDLPATSRRFPYVGFKPERECGKIVLEVRNLKKADEQETLLDNFSLTVNRGDKIAFVGPQNAAKTAFFEIIGGEDTPEAGEYEWGVTITTSYFPKNNGRYFTSDMTIVDWLSQYSPVTDEAYVRGFLGRMLFSGEDALKPVKVLSGGEKVRCLLSKMMLSGANTLILDEPTNHLDLESITALNNGLIEFPEVVLFNSHDHQFISSIANRIVEFAPGGIIDRMMPFDEYMASKEIIALRDELWHGHQRVQI